MKLRTGFIITAACLCLLLAAAPLVTSQMLPAVPSASAREQDVTIRAVTQEKEGQIYKLNGNAVIETESYVLHADQMTFNAETGDATADGHVLLEGGLNDEHIEATHARYNLHSETGHFENVHGTT